MIDFTGADRRRGVRPDPGVADVAERLMGEFGARIDRGAIGGAVLSALHDLQCSPSAARVVGLERLTRDRLRALLGEGELRAG